MQRPYWWASAIGLLLLNLWIVAPLLLPGETPYRDSIGPGYASIAAFFRDHPNPWGWNAFQYCGNASQSTYLPVVPYLVGAVSRVLLSQDTVHVNRCVFLLSACLVPLTWYFFAVLRSGSWRFPFVALACYTVLSPEYALFQTIDADRGLAYLPWRLQVVVKYGEGPHALGLAIIPLALLALNRAARSSGFGSLFLAALLYALVALTNWMATLLLAIFTVILCLTERDNGDERPFRWRRAAFALLLAYGLAAFWLTPGLIAKTFLNWPQDAFGYQFASLQKQLLLACLLGCMLLAWVSRRFVSSYRGFITVGLFFLAFTVSFFYRFGENVIPESRRYAPEFTLFLMLFLFEVLGMACLRLPRRTGQVLLLSVLVFTIVLGRAQLQSLASGEHWRLTPHATASTIEYRIADWLNAQGVRGRVFVSGGTRFRLNSWFPVPQVGGVFESSLDNRIPLDLDYQIRSAIGSEPQQAGRDAIIQLQAMGVEYLAIHGAKSAEYYHDFRDPDRIRPLLQAVHAEGDDLIYRLPFRSLAHAVREDEIVHEYFGGAPRTLDRFAAAVVDPHRPLLNVTYHSSEQISIDGEIRADQPIAFLMSHHPGWMAAQDGLAIPIGKDALGFMILRPSVDQRPIQLEFVPTLEQRIMAGFSGVTWACCLAAWLMGQYKRFRMRSG